MGYYYLLLWMLGILIVMVALFIWMCAAVCYELRMYKIKTGRRTIYYSGCGFFFFDVAVVFFRWVMLSGDYGFSDIWKKISANIDTEE